jgi:hypothetical protein
VVAIGACARLVFVAACELGAWLPCAAAGPAHPPLPPLCSQIINKVAIFYVPAPSFLMFCQMAVSAFVAQAGHWGGAWETDQLEWGKSQKFLLVVLGFLGCIFCNIKVRGCTRTSAAACERSSPAAPVSAPQHSTAH